jgi:prophage regulatory protein
MTKQTLLPETGFLRLPKILTLIPVGKSTWWEGVKSGRFPKPVKLGPRTTAWRAEDIQHLIRKYPTCRTSHTINDYLKDSTRNKEII